MRFRFLSLLLICCLPLLTLPVAAQDIPPRDPRTLAEQLLGVTGEPQIPDPLPAYEVGAVESFWVNPTGAEVPAQIRAELGAVTPVVYIWFEEGMNYAPQAAQDLAAQFSQDYFIFFNPANYPFISSVPQTLEEGLAGATLLLPDVDNDPHLNLLFTKDTVGGLIFNPVNSREANLVPGGYSNQREMWIISMSAFPGLDPADLRFTPSLRSALFSLAINTNRPQLSQWVRNAMLDRMLLQLSTQEPGVELFQPFLQNPGTRLTAIPGLTSGGQEFGAQQLFMSYIGQRFGGEVLTDFLLRGGEGLDPLTEALAAAEIVDLESGEPITAEDVFVDFVFANVLNAPIGDGRFVHRLSLMQGQNAAASILEDQFEVNIPNVSLNQLSSAYLGLQTTQPRQFIVGFQGADAAPRLPIPGPLENRFYWSSDSLDATMTRPFDLTGARSPVLTFDIWHAFTTGWNFGYVQVSTDQGATWATLPATSTTTANPLGLAYGPAFAAISTTEPPRPFPYVGVLAEENIITELVAGAPAEAAGLQVGDELLGHDGEPWGTGETLVSYVSQFEPGDTLSLDIRRGEATLTIEVVAGEHPTRRRVPDPEWVSQSVDLSAYAGQQILLRFNVIKQPGQFDLGMVIDNIAIEAIGFTDDAEFAIPGWTLNGWRLLDNRVQQRFALTATVINPDAVDQTRILRLVTPLDVELRRGWQFSLQPGELFVLAISPLNDNTTVPAQFSLAVQPVDQAVPQATATP
ncbi:MAG TPA: PDZ domain-containing protein [Aggregatilineales bacterium]|nr:PDZ domain-containing protein [Aggregatilineales bacterium]